MIPHHGNGASLVDRRANELIIVGHLPQHLAIGGFFDILVGETRDLFVAVEHHAQAIPAGSLLQKLMHAPRAPERNHVGLRHQQHGVREVADHLHGAVEAARAVHHHKVILAYEQIEQPSQL